MNREGSLTKTVVHSVRYKRSTAYSWESGGNTMHHPSKRNRVQEEEAEERTRNVTESGGREFDDDMIFNFDEVPTE